MLNSLAQTRMARTTYSTAEAAERIGVHPVTLHKWIAAKKIRPSIGVPIGAGRTLWKWTDRDIARGRKIKARRRTGPKSKKSS